MPIRNSSIRPWGISDRRKIGAAEHKDVFGVFALQPGDIAGHVRAEELRVVPVDFVSVRENTISAARS